MRQPIKFALLLLCIGVSIAAYRLFSASHSAPVPPNAPTKAAPASPAGKPPAEKMPGAFTATESVIHPDNGKWSLRQQAPAQATMTEIVSQEIPGSNKHAVHLVVSAVDPKKFWAAQILKGVPQDIRANQKMVVRFWGRSALGTPIWVFFEAGKPPRTPELQKQITLSPTWTQYSIPFHTKSDHVDPHADFCIKAGIKPGVVEVAGIHVDAF